MANKIKISKGDVGDFYEPSDSDEEYTEHEKKLLKKVRKGKQKNEESEDEVMAFDDDADVGDDDFGEYQDNSDFEEENQVRNGIPDERAWGKKRKDFYSTDFVDQDYSSYNANEEQLAEQEESEARAIQQRLAKQLDEADFTLDVYGSAKSVSDTAEVEQTKIHLKTDLSDLSHREKVQMFRKDSPEFDGLVQDFELRLQESQSILEPILEYFNKQNLTTLPIIEFVTTKNNLILTYCSNVAFYLVLKAKRVAIKNHPLVKRLVQMRQLLIQLEEKYERLIRPQLEKLLEDIASGQELVFTEKSKSPKKQKATKKLQILKDMEITAAADDDNDMDDDEDDDEDNQLSTIKAKQSDSEEEEPEEEQEEFGEDDERRQITYQMSKNKGLTPHRKKELRNPRVKHRNKFRKAIIRRKGAVRTVRKEVKRYSGEVSGIKATTKKGIKIK